MSDNQESCCGRKFSRREVLAFGGIAALSTGTALSMKWWRSHEHGLHADTFIGRADYDGNLMSRVEEGLQTLGITRNEVRGKRIMLKPNLVETAVGVQHINTHPAMVVAAAEVFRRMDAADVFVAEGQGHRRDSWLVLEESGMGQALDEAKLRFVDLNHDDFERVNNGGKWTNLGPLYLPKSVCRADWVVSMPKLKTHHWAGVTCSMKNFFGVMPGVIYGWPKTPLHNAGIENSILDINATVKPQLAIVDAIVSMDGDGPIMGNPRRTGCIVMGRNLPAVDATCVRIMRLNPLGVKYLAEASGRLGPIHEQNIIQRGETIASVQTQFAVLDLPHLRSIRLPDTPAPPQKEQTARRRRVVATVE